MGCYHFGCKSGSNGKKTHKFKAPKSVCKEQWLKNIPKQIKPFDFDKSKLCHLHFEEKYLVKTFPYIIKDGVKVPGIMRERWLLTNDAIPTKFGNSLCPSYYNKGVSRKEPRPRICDVTLGHTQQKQKHSPFSIADFRSIQSLLTMPNQSWISQISENGIMKIVNLGVAGIGASVPIEKLISITTSGILSVSIRGQDIPDLSSLNVSDLKEIQSTLDKVDQLQLCRGVKHFEDVRSCKTGIKIGSTWHSTKCEKVGSNLCNMCCLLLKNLRVIRTRAKKIPTNSRQQNVSSLLKKSLSRKTFQLRKSQKNSAFLRLQLKMIQRKLRLKTESSLLESIEKCPDLSSNMKLATTTALKVAKAKSKHGRRYEMDWLLQCLLLKVKSPKAYRHLRENELLPLPDPSTIHRLIRGVPCEFGFPDFIFEALKTEFSSKRRTDRQMVVMFDEMKITEGLDYDKNKLKLNGFVDFGEYTDDYLKKKGLVSQEADHALVFLVGSLNSNCVQPVGVFGSRGAAPAAILAKLLLNCVVRLDAVGIDVVGVVCDGATTNKAMWKGFGISGQYNNVVNKIPHPCDDQRSLHFISDVPHLFKCIRNNMLKKKVVKYEGNDVNFGFYEALYDTERGNSLRVAPKIHECHIKPNFFQKMSVKYATQLFSRTVANAIRFYREKKMKIFHKSQHTESFTRDMNDLFDALNAKLPIQGLKKSSTKYEVIKKFQEILKKSESWNTFGSDTTMSGLRVTLQSTIDLVDYLTEQIGYTYVLSAKFNQDPLEKFFGIIRGIGGGSDHPNVTSFLQLYRLLSVSAPTARFIRGNISGGEEVSLALVSYADILKKHGFQKRKDSEQRRNKIEKSILNKMDCAEKIPEDGYLLDERGVSLPICQGSILYNITGFLAFKAKNFTNCKECIDSLSTTICPSNPESSLLSLRNLGGLKYPSENLFNLINGKVEPVISELLSSGLSKNVTDAIVEKLGCLELVEIGCGKCTGIKSLIARIIMYYISLRMFFYIREHNVDQIKVRVDAKRERKKAKLVSNSVKCSENRKNSKLK